MKIAILILSLGISSILMTQQFVLEKIDDIYTSDSYWHMAKGEHIYTAGNRSLQVLDCDHSGNLVSLGEIPLWGMLGMSTIEVIDNYVYMYGTGYSNDGHWYSRLYRINVENGIPALEDSIHFENNGIIQILGANRHLFFITTFQTLKIYDNENFQLVFEYENVNELFFDNRIYKINDRYIYSWDNNEEGLMHIFDISDIQNIQRIGEINFNEEFPQLYIGNTVTLNENTIVFCHENVFSFFDISNITDLQLISTIVNYPDYALNNLGILNDEQIVIPTLSDKAKLYDISDLENPELLSFCEYSNISTLINAAACLCFNDNFYVIDYLQGLNQCRIEDDQIEYIGKFPKFRTKGLFKREGNLLAIPSMYIGGIHFYDFSDIYHTEYICTHFEDYMILENDFENDLMAITLSIFPEYESSLDIYDISNVVEPVLINRVEDALALLCYLEYPYLYTAESSTGRSERHFIKYDISDSFSPEVIYDINLGSDVSGIFKYGDYFYYGNGPIINILGNLGDEYPVLLEQIYIENLQFFFLLNETYFQTYNGNTCEIYSLENPLEPEFILEFPLATTMNHVGINDNLFLQGSYSTNVYDIENGYDIYNPIYCFERPSNDDLRIFFGENGEKYFLANSSSSLTLFRYEYDNTSLAEEEISKTEFHLTNYPNPFQSSTTISFSITAEITENPEISIYNIKGQKIKTFKNLQINKSPYQQIVWDGKDEAGNNVGSGVYFYQFQTGKSYSKTKKMILLR